MDSLDIPEAVKDMLTKRFEALNPFELREVLAQKLKSAKALAAISVEEWFETQHTQ